jgi:hypothetical protein
MVCVRAPLTPHVHQIACFESAPFWIQDSTCCVLTTSPCAEQIAEKSGDVNQAIDLGTPVVWWRLQHEGVQDVDSHYDDE